MSEKQLFEVKKEVLVAYLGNDGEEIVIPSEVKVIGAYAFSGCGIKSLTVGGNVATIEKGAFEDCTALEKIVLGVPATEATVSLNDDDEQIAVGENAFAGCTALKNISFGDNIKSFGKNAFKNCKAIATLNFKGSLASWCAIAFDGQEANPLLYAGKLAIDGEVLTNFVAPSGVREIAPFAFVGCKSLMRVMITDGVKRVGECAFALCKGVKKVIVADGVSEIGDRAFEGCGSLSGAVVPAGTKLGGDVFKDCPCSGDFPKTESKPKAEKAPVAQKAPEPAKKAEPSRQETDMSYFEVNKGLLKDYTGRKSEVVVPSVIKKIGAWAFSKRRSLIGVVLPASVKSVNAHAFYRCSAMKTVTIDNPAIVIGDYAFEECSALETINFGGTRAQWEAVVKGTCWNYATGAYTVYCTDGKVKK